MTRWEYHVEFADPEKYSQDQVFNRRVSEMLTAKGVGGPHKRKSVVWLTGRLDELGQQGWELIEMRPYKVGANQDVMVSAQAMHWSDGYLLVFKRPLVDSAMDLGL